MDIAKQHWPILRELEIDLANRVRSFMVVGKDGDKVMVATEDGEGFWLGKFGKGRTTNKPIPLNVSGLVQMAQSDSNILLLTENGQIYSMKMNLFGHFGLLNDNPATSFSPQLIPSPHKFISVRCGRLHSVALTEDGKVWAWGNNKFGQVGIRGFNDIFESPCQISKLDRHRFVAVECGGSHSLALTDRGDVYAWGGNNLGQLGDNSVFCTHTPSRMFTSVKSIAAGSRHTLLLTLTGEVYACGSNKFCELGLPIDTRSSAVLEMVEGLPPILQISAHPLTSISIAMSFDNRCFVWGQLHDNLSLFTPRELPTDYSTVESPLSFYSTDRSTPHSVPVSETLPNRLYTRMSRMFDNSETSDVQFVVEQRTIHAHRNILTYSSDYFNRMFSERWLPQVDPEDSIVKVTIPDHSYEVFHTFLRFLYTDCLEVHSDLLPEMFELASQYLESNLQQLCIRRMRITLTTATCCFYYPLTLRHSLPELAAFQQELVWFSSTRMLEIADTAAYQSLESDLRDNLTNAIKNLITQF